MQKTAVAAAAVAGLGRIMPLTKERHQANREEAFIDGGGAVTAAATHAFWRGELSVSALSMREHWTEIILLTHKQPSPLGVS